MIDDIVVGGCRAVAGVVVHVAFGGPADLLRAVKARNVASAIQVVHIGGCKVDRLPLVCGVVVADDEDFWNMGNMGLFAVLTQLSPTAGDSPSMDVPPSRRGERKAGMPERRECRSSEDGLNGDILRGGVIALRDVAE